MLTILYTILYMLDEDQLVETLCIIVIGCVYCISTCNNEVFLRSSLSKHLGVKKRSNHHGNCMLPFFTIMNRTSIFNSY